MNNFITIKDYPNYEINCYGVVRSKARPYLNQFGESTKIRKERILKVYKTTSGYLQVDLCKNSKYKKIGVHQLVAKYFVDGYKYGLEVNHKDCNKENNHYSNLEWMTSSQNKQHAWKNELYPEMTEVQRMARSNNGKNNKKWFPENLQIEALKYKSKKGFRVGSNYAYNVAKKLGILNNICSHMKVLRK